MVTERAIRKSILFLLWLCTCSRSVMVSKRVEKVTSLTWVSTKKIGISGNESARTDQKVKVYLEMELNNWYRFLLIPLIFLPKYLVSHRSGYLWLASICSEPLIKGFFRLSHLTCTSFTGYLVIYLFARYSPSLHGAKNILAPSVAIYSE